MDNVYCKNDVSLTEEEKRVFVGHLEQLEIANNIWDLFGEWVARSAPRINFFYLKVYMDMELMGLPLLPRHSNL